MFNRIRVTWKEVPGVEIPLESKQKYRSLGVFSLEKGVRQYYIIRIVLAIKSTQNVNKEKVVAN